MALPRQVSLSISYGVASRVSSGAGGSGGSGSGGGTYTVKHGDTLWAIAKHYYGSGMKYTIIYDANTEVIESTARAHGKKDSSHGHWIWAGEVLTIPNSGGGQQPASSAVRYNISSSPLGAEIERFAESFTYTDIASGQSDSVSITIADINKEWLGANRPSRGANIGAALNLTEWNGGGQKRFDCGNFILDDISFSGRPLSCVLGGVSVPAMDDFKSLPRTKTWEKTTIESIASEIAAAAGVSLHYEGTAIQIAEIEQNRETDSAFLYSLCEKYGLAMKVYNHKIVIFDFIQYEQKGPVATIRESGAEVLSWSCNTTVEGTYTGVSLGYTDPDTEKAINVTMGAPGRMYSLNTQASSRYDAELQAAAKVNEANRKIETMDISIMANPAIVASHCVQLEGFGGLDGKYFVDQVKHSAGSSGYKMQISAHRVQAPILVTAPAPSAKKGGQSYTVVSGDTLWGISKKFYGTGTKYNVIYDANVDIIESTAKAHGKKDSGNGHWIWAGETLTIPEV